MDVFFPTLFVAVLLVSVEIQGSRSMKDRRSVVKSLIERARSRWDVSAMDLGPDGVWNRGFSAIAPTNQMAVDLLDIVRKFIESMQDAEGFDILEYTQEVERYDHFSHTKNQ